MDVALDGILGPADDAVRVCENDGGYREFILLAKLFERFLGGRDVEQK